MVDNTDLEFSSGIPELDNILQNILPGDNVVLQIDEIEDYLPFIHAFCRNVNKEKKDLIYFRFAQHNYLLPEDIEAQVYELNPKKGFDYFISEIISKIEFHGIGACYVFDSLSNLTEDWYTDVMLGNLFMLVCPYLFELDTVAYFALFRHCHDSKTFADIQETAQVVLDIYNHHDGHLYIHPLKVLGRFSSTIFMLHQWIDVKDTKSSFKTIKESAIIADVLSTKHYQWLDYSKSHIDAWHLTFQKAEETLEGIMLGEISTKESEKFKKSLLKKIILQDDNLFPLAMEYFELQDLLTIRKRLIGTGFIGGKALGMLMARKILKRENPILENKLEKEDSFFIGTEVFYTFLVKNGCWWSRRKLSNPDTFLEGLKETNKKILDGVFPNYLIERFTEVLNYFGQAPIIVRSSSLQEDAYGNSFSGKYESIFLANQGKFSERLFDFIQAIKTVYASAISRDALIYRKNRGLLEKDEQMAILVQRVSGSIYGKYFFPQIAGVGYSFNPYVWNDKIDPKAGVLRLVVGLGTRAVERIEDDFTRLVALNKPLLQLHSTLDDIQKFSQKNIDALNLEENRFVTGILRDIELIPELIPYLNLVATRNYELEERMRRLNRPEVFSWVLTYNNLLEKTPFANDMSEILKILENTYQNPVDIEYTLNFLDENTYKINIVQCRHFQIRSEIKDIKAPEDLKPDSIIIESSGPILGTSIATKIDRIIYVVPEKYAEVPIRERYSIARLIGKINQLKENKEKKVMLLGPGRWGTTTPSLGIPVKFAEIDNVSLLCEIAEKTGGFIPDISLGTHFFNNIVEMEILYFVMYPEREGYKIDKDFFLNSKNMLTKLIPDSNKWINVVKVIDITQLTNKLAVNIWMNALTQKGVCYFIRFEGDPI
jgi:hypothetical protein